MFALITVGKRVQDSSSQIGELSACSAKVPDSDWRGVEVPHSDCFGVGKIWLQALYTGSPCRTLTCCCLLMHAFPAPSLQSADLDMKPQIAGIGGFVFSTYLDGTFATLSGTIG